MTPTRRPLFRSFPLLLLALAATSAQAADSYLKVIPSTALAWGVVNHMNEASDKIKNLATIAQAPAVSVLDEIKKESGIEKGLDEKGAAGFFVVPGKTEKEPVPVLFVAVADYKEFLSNFKIVKAGDPITEVTHKVHGGSGFIAQRLGYALFVPDTEHLAAGKEPVRAALEAALEAKQDISAEMAGMEPWLAENDGSVVGTAPGIKLAAKLAGEELKKAKEDLPAGPDMAVLSSILSLYGTALEIAPKEISLAVAGVRCDKQGSIRVIGRARLVNGGLVSNAVGGIPPVAENLFSGVPGGPFVFAEAGVNVLKLAEGYLNLAAGLLKGMKSVHGMSAEDIDRISKEPIEIVRQVRSVSFVMKSGTRGDPIYSNMFSAMRVDNAQRVLDLFEKLTANADKLVQGAKQGVLKSITVKRLEIAGKAALQQEVNFDLSSIAGAEANRAVLEEMLGVGGKMLLYYVAADEHTVLMGIGVSQERMAAALDVIKQPRKSLAEDADVAVTAAMLPADSQWVVYVSPRGYAQLMQRAMVAAMKNSPMPEGFSLPQFHKSPPAGFALKAMPAELHAEIAVPAELIKAGGEYVQDMQKMFMNRAMEQNQPPAP